MKKPNVAVARPSKANPGPITASATASAASCRNCGTALPNREYYCPECDTPHFAHLRSSLLSPSIKFLAFFMVIAGPIAAYTLWEVVQRFAWKI
ncbi:MAG: hypothetical protein SH859_09415 [Hyphomicrobium aestuarii]|nr:hypothetical protein [Hyphomicrobium aestuarii]